MEGLFIAIGKQLTVTYLLVPSGTASSDARLPGRVAEMPHMSACVDCCARLCSTGSRSVTI